VPLARPGELQKALLTLASNPKTYTDMSDHAAALAAEFSWHKLIEQVLREVYP
jgi:glycosyltransferase involved in cell wall biosynthesis